MIKRTFINLLNEELTDKQKSMVDSWPRGDTSFSDHIFGGKHNDRIAIPLEDHSEIPPNPKIAKHLEKHGYIISSYKHGLAKSANGREMKIGKILHQTKADDTLKKEFETDPSRIATRKHNNLHVIISRPSGDQGRYDVAGQSTDRGWTSCLNLNPYIDKHGKYREIGPKSHTLAMDIAHGTHVAYLCHNDDMDISKPLARMSLKPHVSEDGSHRILFPEPFQYGSGGNSFDDTARKFCEKHFPLRKKTLYKLEEGLSSDRSDRRYHSHIHSDDPETLTHFANSPSSEHHSAVLNHRDAKKYYNTLLSNPNLNDTHSSTIINSMNKDDIQSMSNSSNTNTPIHILRGLVNRKGIKDPSNLINSILNHSDKNHSLFHDTTRFLYMNNKSKKLQRQMREHEDTRVRHAYYASLNSAELQKEYEDRDTSSKKIDPALIKAASLSDEHKHLLKHLLSNHSSSFTSSHIKDIEDYHKDDPSIMKSFSVLKNRKS